MLKAEVQSNEGKAMNLFFRAWAFVGKEKRRKRKFPICNLLNFHGIFEIYMAFSYLVAGPGFLMPSYAMKSDLMSSCKEFTLQIFLV